MDSKVDRSEGVLERAIKVLESFTADEPVLTAALLAERTGLAISSMHRLLIKLRERGLIEKVAPHGYAVGLKLWKIGELNPTLLELREEALPHLMRLYEATGENVQLAILDGATPATAQVLYVARLIGDTSSPTLTRIGGSFPLHTTGVGKVLLANKDDDWISRYVSAGLPMETQFSITDGAALTRSLNRVRTSGYATTREEMSLGTASVAAPLEPVSHFPPAAIGVVTSTEMMKERELSAIVLVAARRLSSHLRDRFER